MVYDFGTAEYIGFHCSYSRNITVYPTYTNPLSDEEISASPLPIIRGTSSISDISDLDLSSSVISTSSSDTTTPNIPLSISTPSGSNDDGGSDGVDVGAIVGGVIGGLAIIAIIAIAYLFFRHRRQKRRDTLAAEAAAATATTATTTAANPHDFVIAKAEMPVQDGELSPKQPRYGSVAMSATESTMLDGMSPVSPDRFRYELSPVNNDA